MTFITELDENCVKILQAHVTFPNQTSSQAELNEDSVRHSLGPPFIVEFLEFAQHLAVCLSVGGVATARLTDCPRNVERLVWTNVIGRYILLWKEQIHK